MFTMKAISFWTVSTLTAAIFAVDIYLAFLLIK